MTEHTINVGDIPDKKLSEISVNLIVRSTLKGYPETINLRVMPLHPEQAIVEAIKQVTGFDDMKIRPTDTVAEYQVLAAWVDV